METKSQEIGKLAEALAKAQAVIEGAREDNKNPFFKSRYADLKSVWAACKKPLTDNGLAVLQTVELVGERVVLVTTLAHSSGQWVKSYLPIIVMKNDPQSQGSAMTYARRYALAALVGVCPADDDGETAMNRGSSGNGTNLSQKQLDHLSELSGMDREGFEKILSHLSISSLEEIPGSEYNRVLTYFQKRKEKSNDGSTRVA